MTYSEALEIRANNLNLIGTIVTSGESQCDVEDIIIAPPELIIHFLEDYKKTYNQDKAISRFITRIDLEVMTFGINPNTMGEIVLKVNDLDH